LQQFSLSESLLHKDGKKVSGKDLRRHMLSKS